MINRREAIRRTAWLMGTAVSAPAAAGIMNGCTPTRDEPDWEPVFLNEPQVRLCADMAERILPRTDTPGATDVGIDRFIDLMLNECYPKKDQDNFTRGLELVDQLSNDLYKDNFPTLDEKHQIKVMENITLTDQEDEKLMAYNTIRELTLLGYFTSEAGIKANFNYQPVPGRYEGCVSIKEQDKFWRGLRI